MLEGIACLELTYTCGVMLEEVSHSELEDFVESTGIRMEGSCRCWALERGRRLVVPL